MPGLALRLLPREFWTDARHYQIAALSTLLLFNLVFLDFGAQPLNSVLAIAFALTTQALCTWSRCRASIRARR